MSSVAGVSWNGVAESGKLDEAEIPDDKYESKYLIVGDSKSDSSYPVVGGDGQLYIENLSSAWDLRGQGSDSQKAELEEKIKKVYNKVDVTVDAIESALSDTDSDPDNDGDGDSDGSDGKQNVLSRRQVINTIGGDEVREVTAGGRTYLEFPIVPLREMVLNYPERGVREFVSKKNLQESVPRWSDIPLRPTHPRRNARGEASARSADGYMGQTIGRSYDPESVDDGAIRTWGRVDVQKANDLGGVHKQVVDKLRAGETLPVSAGYDTEGDVVRAGRHNGTAYDVEQGRIMPDHIALIVGNERARAMPSDGVAAPRLNYVDADVESSDMLAVSGDEFDAAQSDGEAVRRRLRDAMGLVSALWEPADSETAGASDASATGAVDSDTDDDGAFLEKIAQNRATVFEDMPGERSADFDSGSDSGTGTDVSTDGSEDDRIGSGSQTPAEETDEYVGSGESGESAMRGESTGTKGERVGKILQSGLPFEREEVEDWSDDRLDVVVSRLEGDGFRLNAEDGDDDSSADSDGTSDDDDDDDGDSDGDGTAVDSDGDDTPDDEYVQNIDDRLSTIEKEREDRERAPAMRILRERSSLSEETLAEMETDEIYALAQDYPDPLEEALPVEEGTGARQDELESRSMAAAPAGGQRQNTISRDTGEPDEALSGRDAYEKRQGGGD